MSLLDEKSLVASALAFLGPNPYIPLTLRCATTVMEALSENSDWSNGTGQRFALAIGREVGRTNSEVQNRCLGIDPSQPPDIYVRAAGIHLQSFSQGYFEGFKVG